MRPNCRFLRSQTDNIEMTKLAGGDIPNQNWKKPKTSADTFRSNNTNNNHCQCNSSLIARGQAPGANIARPSLLSVM